MPSGADPGGVDDSGTVGAKEFVVSGIAWRAWSSEGVAFVAVSVLEACGCDRSQLSASAITETTMT